MTVNDAESLPLTANLPTSYGQALALGWRTQALLRRVTIKIYEGHTGTRLILEDILKTMGSESSKQYRVYSAANIREYLYYNFTSFSERRIKAGVKARVIAIGAAGEVRGLDERRWITTNRSAPAYTIIYGSKVAIISLGQRRPRSVGHRGRRPR